MSKCVGFPIRRGGCQNEATNPPTRYPLWCDMHEGVRRGSISKDLADIAESFRSADPTSAVSDTDDRGGASD